MILCLCWGGDLSRQSTLINTKAINHCNTHHTLHFSNYYRREQKLYYQCIHLLRQTSCLHQQHRHLLLLNNERYLNLHSIHLTLMMSYRVLSITIVMVMLHLQSYQYQVVVIAASVVMCNSSSRPWYPHHSCSAITLRRSTFYHPLVSYGMKCWSYIYVKRLMQMYRMVNINSDLHSVVSIARMLPTERTWQKFIQRYVKCLYYYVLLVVCIHNMCCTNISNTKSIFYNA